MLVCWYIGSMLTVMTRQEDFGAWFRRRFPDAEITPTAFAARAGSIRSSARLSGENAAVLAAALRQIAETIERVAGRVDAIERAAELLERTALDKDGRNGK